MKGMLVRSMEGLLAERDAHEYVLTQLSASAVTLAMEAHGYTTDDRTQHVRRLAYVDDRGNWIMDTRTVHRVPIAPDLLAQIVNVMASRDTRGRELPRRG